MEITERSAGARGARTVACALLLAVLAAPAVAQQHGNVVYVSPKHGTGLSIMGDFARGLNDASFKTNYFGGRAILGLPLLTVSAGVGVVNTDDALDPGGESEITFGGLASLNVISAPLMPVAVAIFAGAGYLKESATGPGSDETTINVPVGAAIAFSVPSPSVSVEPWIAPRLHISRVSNGTSNTDSNFGVSGGVNIGLPNGLGFHAAFDYVAVSSDLPGVSSSDVSPFIVGVGVHYKFSVPGLGM